MRIALKWQLFASILVTSIGLDQWTKHLILKHYRLGESLYILPILDLTYIRNKGAAFGFCHDCPAWFRDSFFLVVPVVALSVILAVYWKVPRHQGWVHWALSLIAGGAVGNLIDRARLGYVVDFLYFHWGPHYWPAFNIADSCIVVGVGMMFLHSFFPRYFGGLSDPSAGKERP